MTISTRIISSLFVTVTLITLPTVAGGISPMDDWRAHVSGRLLAEMSVRQGNRPPDSTSFIASPATNRVRIDKAGRVQVDIFHNCDSPVDNRLLGATGFSASTTLRAPPMCVTEGWAAFESVPIIAVVTNVTRVDLPVYASVIEPLNPGSPAPITNSVSPIDGAGVTIMRADQYVQITGTNGAGVTVGVMSGDVINLAVIQGRGELPSPITIYPSGSNPSPDDEGTVMLEEVHAVAPGATLAFCGPQTEVEYVSCLQSFAVAQVNIAVDDLGYPADDLMSDQSPFAQAVAGVLAASPGLSLFSSSDNNNGDYWQGNYNPSAFTIGSSTSLTCSANGQIDKYLHNFGGVLYETGTVSQTYNGPLYLQWADPFNKNVSNFDLYILDNAFNVLLCINGAGSPLTFDALVSTPIAPGTYHLLIGTPDQAFSGKFLKLLAFGNGLATLTITTNGSVESPQKFVAGVETIGAVNGGDGIGNTIEPFSGTGPIQLAFPTPHSIQAPIVVSPDNVFVDNTGTLFPTSMFQGTSAAAPNAAAVAALLEASFRGASTSILLAAIQNGAVQLGATLPNGTFGYGRVDAIGALNTLPTPTITLIGDQKIVGGQSSGQIPITLSGVGTLSLTTSSDNPALVNSGSIGTSGTVSVTSAQCGVSASSCNLVVTPANGQVGTAHVTVQVSDGANRKASSTFTVTVTAPPSSGGGGGVSWLLMLIMLLGLPYLRRRVDC